MNNILNQNDAIEQASTAKFCYVPIPCQHEKNGLDTGVVVDDYHPLTKQQINELLDEALRSDNPSMQQARLIQAIPGIKCPSEIDNDIAKKETNLSNYFVMGLRRGWWTDSQKHKMTLICSGT